MSTNSKNPFSPSFGKTPGLYIDRGEVKEDIVRNLEVGDDLFQTTLVSGPRGSGKTALLSEVSSHFKGQKNWVVINLSASENILKAVVVSTYNQISGELKKMADKGLDVKISVFGIEADISRPGMQSEDDVALRMALEHLLQTLKKKKMNLLVIIDEIEDTERLRTFTSLYQIMIRENYPINLLMSGLPQNITRLQNEDGLTFLLRANRIELMPIELSLIKECYEDIFPESDVMATARAAYLTQGYAYAFQLMGYLLWRRDPGSVTAESIDAIIKEYKRNLYRKAYQKIFMELSAKDEEFVVAMARSQDRQVKLSEIYKYMNCTEGYAQTYRRRMMTLGLIRQAKYGYVEFVLPFFKEYIVEEHLAFQALLGEADDTGDLLG